MQFVLKSLLLSFLFIHCLHADWNNEFDQQTQQLTHQITEFQNTDYISKVQRFEILRNNLLTHRTFIKKIQKWEKDDKIIVYKKSLGLIVKKRRDDRIKDLYPWELSYYTGSNEFTLPSFPLEIAGMKVIIQELEEFAVGDRDGHLPEYVRKVPLETYWKAFLQAYLFGMGDLGAKNIGINRQGDIRFFDIEACLRYRNTPHVVEISPEKVSVDIGFFCDALDWPQYSAPISQITAKVLQSYVNHFIDHLEEKFALYFTIRPTDVNLEELNVRIRILREFRFLKGMTFYDFILAIYPKMAPGLNDLSQIIRKITGKRAGHGTCLAFLSRYMKRTELSPEDYQALNHWIDCYVR